MTAAAAFPLCELSDVELVSLGQACGLPLAAYRRSHLEACVTRAVVRMGVADAGALADRLRRDDSARAAFRRSVLVPVTRMFRDEAEFRMLEREVLPELLARRERLDVWSAGCATGDELRSVASLLERLGALDGALLVGSDLLEDALEQAVELAARLAEPMRGRFRFERRNLVVDDLPARRFDLVLCRNVAIYLEPSAQAAVHRKLVAALRLGGFLMLGASETLLRPELLGLEPVGRHLFRRVAA